ncbi:M1 family metallopeptidase [Pedobacter sp. AW1-32]|uniref:M1 family metallopeptidase n=1 Tax=Pedobacter sp. AW1-32 TaxID=3383026 RepID=UPI003FEFE35F
MIKHSFKFYLFSLCLCSVFTAFAGDPVIQKGVSKELAVYRKSVLSNLNYELKMDIPAEKTGSIIASENLHFDLTSTNSALQLDFREDGSKIKAVFSNGKQIPIVFKDEHLILEKKHLLKGANTIHIDFIAGESALNRNADYLYALFVPDRARTVFPCFDQPDLKATYNLTLILPESWKAIANAAVQEKQSTGGRTTYIFKTSNLISTYLFSFAAGKFEEKTDKVSNMDAQFLYRETDQAKIETSMAEIFKIHTKSLNFFEQWTGISYPFQKFGFVAIPDFQFGGMEHVGAIDYKSSSIFLDPSATKDQLNSRANLIAHETAHMWFGDMVTMQWFDDVWMKEVFANFMADKSNEEADKNDNFDLKFLDHFPAAYSVDRTTGSNPIRQQLDNLQDAGTMYGNIIYHKAPIMMRQLELLMGKEKFRQGIQAYLKKFANTNATWPQLIEVLSDFTTADLKKWNKVWVNETGRPIVNYSSKIKDGKIEEISINQNPEYGKGSIWPQFFELSLFYPDHVKQIDVNFNAAKVSIPEAKGLEKPLFILFNSKGHGYGLWPVDVDMLSKLFEIEKPLMRASAYVSLYENMLNSRTIKPKDLLLLFARGLNQEQEELNLKTMSGYISSIYWTFLSAEERGQISELLEKSTWNAGNRQTLPNNKKILFKLYLDIFSSKSARETLYEIWAKQIPPAGVKLTEDDYTTMAFALALRDDSDVEILNKQLARIINPDRRMRFEFMMPALSGNVDTRDAFFKSLEQKANRQKEANVTSALYYLHHPLRQSSSIKYLAKSLDLLSEIQRTGDIFFPQNWLSATFGNYQSPEAEKIVHDFLTSHADYNNKLRLKILQSADNLFRANKLIKNE